MKKLFLIGALSIVGRVAIAQTNPGIPQPKPEIPIYVKLLPSQLYQLVQVLTFSFQWVPKSSTPSNQVEEVKTIMQQLYPTLIADTTIIVTPKPLPKKK